MNDLVYDLVVLGGGAGGLNVATAAVRVGAKVALIEKHRLGGECTLSACVPSKALIRAANLVQEVRRAETYGLRVSPPEVDFAAVMARVRGVVESFAGSGSGEGLRAQGIDVVFGSPAFEAYDTILVDGTRRIQGRRFVIATGSRPAVPNVPGLYEAGYLDNESIWGLDTRPGSLVVLGAGPVGLEFGQAFARLGTKVTILADGPHILPREDPEISDLIQSLLEAEGITFQTGVEVSDVLVRDGLKVCQYRHSADELPHEVAADCLLVATGRLANVEGLNLDAAGVHGDAESGIEVDDYLKTRTRHIYAIGDVLGHHQWTHAAHREAAVVFQNAVLRLAKRIDYTAVPWATFTDPEVATVGRLDEPEGIGLGETRLLRVAFGDLDRARIDGRTAGLAKLRATPAGKILGVTIAGAEASTILQEFVLAMEQGLTLHDLAETVHPYPSYAGLARQLASQFTANRLEGGLAQTALRWFLGFRPRSASDNDGPAAPEPVETTGH